jgi:hypothetical protein
MDFRKDSFREVGSADHPLAVQLWSSDETCFLITSKLALKVLMIM